MNKSLSLSLGDLRNFKDVKPIPGTKYYIGYDGSMFNLKPLTKQKPLSLKNLRNFQNIKPVTGTKYYLEYDGKRFNIKPIPPPKPESVAIIEFTNKDRAFDLIHTHYLINTSKITFNEDKRGFYVLPGTYLMEMSLTSENIQSNEKPSYSPSAFLTVFFVGESRAYELRRSIIYENGVIKFENPMVSRLIRIKNKSLIRFDISPIPISILTFILRPFDDPINTF